MCQWSRLMWSQDAATAAQPVDFPLLSESWHRRCRWPSRAPLLASFIVGERLQLGHLSVWLVLDGESLFLRTPELPAVFTHKAQEKIQQEQGSLQHFSDFKQKATGVRLAGRRSLPILSLLFLLEGQWRPCAKMFLLPPRRRAPASDSKAALWTACLPLSRQRFQHFTGL